MRLADIVISALVGGAVGFAASHYLASQSDTADEVAAIVDARVQDRLTALGIAQKSDLDSRISGGVAQFMVDQPEEVLAALERHQANEEKRQDEERRKAVLALGDALTNQPGDPVIGASAEEADITLVEFFDYRCGYCRRSLETVLAIAETDPKLRVVMKEFPILGPESVAAARMSLAAYKLDPKLYEPLHLALFAHGGGYTKDDLLTVATTVGYDPDALEAAMAEQGIREQIRNAYDVAEALGIRGTPAFVIGEQVIPGAVSEARLREAIAEARAAAAEKG